LLTRRDKPLKPDAPGFFVTPLSTIMSLNQNSLLPRDWENPQILSVNRQPAHATSIPYADAETAFAGERDASPFFRLLNGNWKFSYLPSPEAVPAGFEGAEYDASD